MKPRPVSVWEAFTKIEQRSITASARDMHVELEDLIEDCRQLQRKLKAGK
jgi:hypothetical protein